MKFSADPGKLLSWLQRFVHGLRFLWISGYVYFRRSFPSSAACTHNWQGSLATLALVDYARTLDPQARGAAAGAPAFDPAARPRCLYDVRRHHDLVFWRWHGD
jgi:hypothetical protein